MIWILLLAAAVGKILGGVLQWQLTPCSAAAPPVWLPAWYYAGLVAAFVAVGAWLIGGSVRRSSASWLGTTFVLYASLLADRVIASTQPCAHGVAAATASVLLSLQPIAFVCLTLWHFAWSFPREQEGLLPAWLTRRMPHACALVGGVLFTANLAADAQGVAPGARGWLSWLGTDTPNGQFWLLLAVFSLPSVWLLGRKLGASGSDERRRLNIILAGLAVGILPMIGDVLLTASSSDYAAFFSDPTRRSARALCLTQLSLAAPAATAYAVIVRKVLDLKFVLRKGVQYALAKYTLYGALAVPSCVLLAFLVQHRDQRLDHLLLSNARVAWLLVLVALSTLTRFRRAILTLIDRRFFKEQYDARLILATLVELSRRTTELEGLASLICREIDRALHVDRLALLVRSPQSGNFADVLGRMRPVALSAAFESLLLETSDPFEIDLSASRSPVARLPASDREWLADAGLSLLVPVSDGSQLWGLLALGEKRSQTPFTRDDHLMLVAIAAATATFLARQLQTSGLATPQIDEAAASECTECGTVAPPHTATCVQCGHPCAPAALPAVLAGKFRLLRQLGHGGMGVVYLARDLELERLVAFKTLPRITPADSVRLRREARAMASLHHPHLAVVYGMEVWHGTPVLAMEFLARGTLADRLRHRRAVALSAIAELGVAMADVLATLHRTGLLHGDVKPSNIGYTADGVPKLLDFGLAQLADAIGDEDSTRSHTQISGGDEAASGGHDGLSGMAGTLAYMSPEVIARERRTGAADVWALAVTLYEATTGTSPFAGTTTASTVSSILAGRVTDPRELRPDCPDELARLLLSALESRRDRRPQTAVEILDAMRLVRDAVAR